jgi:hypothetical protein
MESLQPYLELAKATTRTGFFAQVEGFFLVKRPARIAPAAPAPGKIEFVTSYARAQVDPYATEWRILPVRKKPDNPYPDRISVGRATNCDVVIRLPFVSKVHAHLVVEPDESLSLRGNQPDNPTLHNGRRLEPGASCRLAVGDLVGIGTLEFEFVDAERLYQLLTTELG